MKPCHSREVGRRVGKIHQELNKVQVAENEIYLRNSIGGGSSDIVYRSSSWTREMQRYIYNTAASYFKQVARLIRSEFDTDI